MKGCQISFRLLQSSRELEHLTIGNSDFLFCLCESLHRRGLVFFRLGVYSRGMVTHLCSHTQ